MTNLANSSTLQEANTQLPVSWYLDPSIYQQEQHLLFNPAPGYVGHELMVPEMGDYQVLPWLNGAQALVHNRNGIELLSNVCRHRQAVLLEGRGNLRATGNNIVCPLHRWTYDAQGQLLGAPHFPQNPCLHLKNAPLQRWNGLLFTGRRNVVEELAGLGVARDLDFSGYTFNRMDVVEYNFNWKTFIEVYLEDYHVEPFHPGLGNFVDCGDLKWEFGENYSVQTVGVNQGLAKAGSGIYQQWHDRILGATGGEPPKYGAIWMLYYPNIMIEWYPHVLVISHIIPQGPEKCLNVVEFYYEDVALFEPGFVEAEQAAYNETAREDEEICRRMQEGRRALFLQGRNEVGPYQSPMEDGMVHFHEYLRRHLDGAAGPR